MGNVIVKTIAGFAFVILLMGLALFLPAGSLNFWQAWVYLFVYSVCTLLITVFLIKNDPKLLARRVHAGPTAETQKVQKLIQGLASLFFIALYVVSGLDQRFHWSDVPPCVSLSSDAFVVLGFSIVFLVFQENTYASAVIEVTEGQKVISSGPYRVVRHPMYSGAGLMLLFSPPALDSWAALPCAVLLMLVVVARLIEEEKYLAAHLSGYEEYRQRVRYRLVPFIW